MIKWMRSCALLAGVFLAATVAQAEGSLTEERIRKMASAVETAARDRDASKVMQHFAPDATIQLVMPPKTGLRTLNLSAREYHAMLRESWRDGGSSTYRVEDIAIEISPDGQTAEMTDITFETMQLGHRTLSSKTRESISIALVDGRVLITRFVGRVTLDLPAARAR